jgi:hypothetical protein
MFGILNSLLKVLEYFMKAGFQIAIGLLLWLFALTDAQSRSDSSEEAGRESAELEWSHAGQTAIERLFEQGESIFPLAAKLAESEPHTAPEAMFALNILMRAGFEAEAGQAVERLRELAPGLSEHEISRIYYAACDAY